MTTDLADLENEVLGLLRRHVAQVADELSRLGLRVEEPRLKRSGPRGSKYSSEVTVYFSDDHGIFDVVEFQVCRDNGALATPSEIDAWLAKTMGDVVSRRRAHVQSRENQES